MRTHWLRKRIWKLWHVYYGLWRLKLWGREVFLVDCKWLYGQNGTATATRGIDLRVRLTHLRRQYWWISNIPFSFWIQVEILKFSGLHFNDLNTWVPVHAVDLVERKWQNHLAMMIRTRTIHSVIKCILLYLSKILIRHIQLFPVTVGPAHVSQLLVEWPKTFLVQSIHGNPQITLLVHDYLIFLINFW